MYVSPTNIREIIDYVIIDLSWKKMQTLLPRRQYTNEEYTNSMFILFPPTMEYLYHYYKSTIYTVVVDQLKKILNPMYYELDTMVEMRIRIVHFTRQRQASMARDVLKKLTHERMTEHALNEFETKYRLVNQCGLIE